MNFRRTGKRHLYILDHQSLDVQGNLSRLFSNLSPIYDLNAPKKGFWITPWPVGGQASYQQPVVLPIVLGLPSVYFFRPSDEQNLEKLLYILNLLVQNNLISNHADAQKNRQP